MQKLIFYIGLFLLGSLTHVFAQEATPNVSKKQVRQHYRIKEGVKSGELTRKEAKALRAEQRHIRRTKRRAKADGDVTRRERKAIHRKQRRANRHIYRQKHDAQDRN